MPTYQAFDLYCNGSTVSFAKTTFIKVPQKDLFRGYTMNHISVRKRKSLDKKSTKMDHEIWKRTPDSLHIYIYI